MSTTVARGGSFFSDAIDLRAACERFHKIQSELSPQPRASATTPTTTSYSGGRS
jgi:hypothetical protein